MNSSYYTNDLFCLSYGTMFRLLAAQSIGLAIIAFPYFAFRKLMRWRFRPTSAEQRPERFHLVTPAEFPPEAAAAIAHLVQAAIAAGFEIVACSRKHYIGNKREYGVALMDASSQIAVEIVWVWEGIGQATSTQTTLMCVSLLSGDRELTTLANPQIEVLAEFFPAWLEFQFLPGGTLPAMVIQRHRQAVVGRSAVVPIDRSTLLEVCLRRAQRAFDHLVARGMLVPISLEEERSLRALSPGEPVRAELVR